MFGYTPPTAFVIRFSLFCLLFSTYPLMNLFLRTHLLNLFFQKRQVSQCHLTVVNALIAIIPLCFAIWFPEIGTIMAFTGAFAGFVIIYCLPVMVFLKKRYLQITNPILAEAIALNECRVIKSNETLSQPVSPSHHSQSRTPYNQSQNNSLCQSMQNLSMM